jgi:hypothetical protein
MEQAVYVYGVLTAGDVPALRIEGVEGVPVRTVQREDLAALVSDLDRATIAAPREVRAHWRVLEAASRHATVLPARFGTVMAGDDAVREGLLAPNAPDLTAMLRRLAGRVQLNVKGRYDEDRLLRDVVAGSPEIAALRERVEGRPAAAGYYDRIRLGELVAAEVERRRAADTARALAHLEPRAVAARADEPGRPEVAFNLSFLVDAGQVDELGAGVAALKEELGDRVTVRYVGPLPPYSFAEAELSAAGAM